MKKNNSVIKLVALLVVLLLAGTLFVTGIPLSKLFGYYDIASTSDQISYGLDFTGGIYIVLEAEDEGGELSEDTLDKAIATIRTRIDSMGVSEPTITKQGNNQIRISIPNISDQEEALDMVGKTAQLEFKDEAGNVILTGNDVVSATYEEIPESSGSSITEPGVKLTFSDAGKTAFAEATAANIGKIIYIVLDGEVISNPTVNTAIPDGEAYINHLESKEAAMNLATLIRAGALPVSFSVAQVETIGPTLGADSLSKSLIAGIIGVLLVMVFMVGVYRIPGIAADIALAAYTIIFMNIMALLKVTLTLPGVAGIILSIGMAVDSNVIIFERVKEELQLGKSVKTSVNTGFSRAFSTILDANITTIIAGAALFFFGSGSVKGFALTLIIGVVVSLVTAVFFTKHILLWVTDIWKITKLSSFGVSEKKTSGGFRLAVCGNWKRYFAVAGAVILAGIICIAAMGMSWGIDFAGGSITQYDLHTQFETADIRAITDEFDPKCDITTAGDEATHVMISSTIDFDEEARLAMFEKFQAKYNLTEADMLSFNKVSATIGKDLQMSALKASAITVFCILIYITVRFEFLFGLAAIAALIHDLLVVLGVYALFRLPVNSSFIAALLTILGYSINNTIVVFDRVRENRKRYGKNDYANLVDDSVNQTLTRSLYTTLTTLLAVGALYVFGVSSIREFALPMIIGFVAGLYSSVCLAGSLWFMMKAKGKTAAVKK